VTNPVAKRLIDQAKRLPARDRRRVVSALETSLTKASAAQSGRRPAGSYDALLALAGTAHSDAEDVSSDKYENVAAAYARKR
jgi:hypothetical protein